jgi:hypothetical protein
MYRLGMPTHVLGAPEKGEWGGSQPVYTVGADKEDQNAMPKGSKADDYDEWVYEEANPNVRLTVEFSKSSIVKSLNLYSNSEKSYGWTRIAGIGFGDSEEEIIRLGAPSNQTLDGVTKTIEYADLGLKVWLTKGKAYMVQIQGTPQNDSTVFWKFLRVYF